jgi:hypothetical protein
MSEPDHRPDAIEMLTGIYTASLGKAYQRPAVVRGFLEGRAASRQGTQPAEEGKPFRPNCRNCGAPHESARCSYCLTPSQP